MSSTISLAKALRPASRDDFPIFLTGIVARAPVDGTSPLQVTLPHADDLGAQLEPIGYWPSRGASLPAVGDACVVAILSDTGEPFIVAWKTPGWGGS